MLEVKNLSITYKSTERTVINNLSFSLDKGETLSVMGPSGCGKTTLLSLIQNNGIIEGITTSGQIKYPEGVIVRTVFQEPRLLPWKNVYENIRVGKLNSSIEDKIEIREIIKQLGLENYEDYYPDQLSLGMKQRVNFARAIISTPDVLLLDEPFSSLDGDTKNQVIESFKKIIIKKKISTILVTHDEAESVKLSNKVVKISEIR